MIKSACKKALDIQGLFLNGAISTANHEKSLYLKNKTISTFRSVVLKREIVR